MITVLQHIPGEPDAIQCKCVAQIRLGDFNSALKTARAVPLEAAKLQFEQAYCLYRLRLFEEGS